MARRDIEVSLSIEGGGDVGLRLDGGDESALSLDAPYVGGGGTNDYNKLINKPSIEGVELAGDKTFPELDLDRIPRETVDSLVSGILG